MRRRTKDEIRKIVKKILQEQRLAEAAAPAPNWCKNKLNPNEDMICRTPGLYEFEQENTKLWKLAMVEDPTGAGSVKARKKFVRERNACGTDPDCTANVYKRRISDLRAGTKSTPKPKPKPRAKKRPRVEMIKGCKGGDISKENFWHMNQNRRKFGLTFLGAEGCKNMELFRAGEYLGLTRKELDKLQGVERKEVVLMPWREWREEGTIMYKQELYNLDAVAVEVGKSIPRYPPRRRGPTRKKLFGLDITPGPAHHFSRSQLNIARMEPRETPRKAIRGYEDLLNYHMKEAERAKPLPIGKRATTRKVQRLITNYIDNQLRLERQNLDNNLEKIEKQD